jgi:hypothetical protein
MIKKTLRTISLGEGGRGEDDVIYVATFTECERKRLVHLWKVFDC